MIQQAIDLALGRAFTPDPLDAAVPLARRFRQRPLVAATLYKDGIEAVALSFIDGLPVFGPAEFSPAGGEDADAAFLRSFAERHKAVDCLLSLGVGYTAVLSGRTRRPESDEEALLLMRDNPERLLGEPSAQGCRHSIAYHPTHNFAVVFAHRESEINAALALAAKAELGLARLQCGVASLLIHVLDHHWPEVGTEAEFLLVDRASLFHLPVAEGGFGRPLFDVGLKEAALQQALGERIGRLKPAGRVLLVDGSGLGVAKMIRDRWPGAVVVAPMQDQARPYLAACAGDRPRLGYDLYPAERAVRPFAPARLRLVTFSFWGALAASVAFIGYNTVQGARAERLAANFRDEAQLFTSGQAHQSELIQDIDARQKTAAAIRDWLVISPPTQSLLIALTKEIEAAAAQGLSENKPVAQVDSLSLTLQEGQPQMRMVLVILGDASAANRIFQRISALFGRLGYSTVDLKQTLMPQGFRYEHLLNLPKPGAS